MNNIDDIRARDAAMPAGYVLVPELVDRRALIAKIDQMQLAIDALGVAIANAGYTWTPEMRTAYELAALERT